MLDFPIIKPVVIYSHFGVEPKLWPSMGVISEDPQWVADYLDALKLLDNLDTLPKPKQ